jgi:carbamoylphosphate synthase large subunit
MAVSKNNRMNPELLASLLSKITSSDDRERFFEAMSLITDDISRRIILKAASPHSPVAINEFKEVNATSMIRHLNQLEYLGILEPTWEDNLRKSAITEVGKEVAKILEP